MVSFKQHLIIVRVKIVFYKNKYTPAPRVPHEFMAHTRQYKKYIIAGSFIAISMALLPSSSQDTFDIIIVAALGIIGIVYGLFFMGNKTALVDNSSVSIINKGRTLKSYPLNNFVLYIDTYSGQNGIGHYMYEMHLKPKNKLLEPKKNILLHRPFFDPKNLKEFTEALIKQLDDPIEVRFGSQAAEKDYKTEQYRTPLLPK